MRRRWPWILGTAGALVLVFLIRGFFVPSGPLRFLEDFPMKGPGSTYWRNGTTATYSFPTDGTALVTEANAELIQRGFVTQGEGIWLAPKGAAPRMVEVLPNHRYNPETTWGSSTQRRNGWVVVRLDGLDREPTLWDRLRAAFGL